MFGQNKEQLEAIAAEGVKMDLQGVIQGLAASEVMLTAINNECTNRANSGKHEDAELGAAVRVAMSRLAEAASAAQAAVFNVRNIAENYADMDGAAQ